MRDTLREEIESRLEYLNDEWIWHSAKGNHTKASKRLREYESLLRKYHEIYN